MCPTAATRIVFCITELDLGGAERALTQLVLSLNRDEWEPYVICLGPSGHFVEPLVAAGIPVTCLNAAGWTSLPRVLVRLTHELRRIRPQVLQTFLFHANILGRFAALFARIPVVVSGLRVAERRSAWYGRIDRWTNSLVSTNVAVSQGVADFSTRITRLRPEKMVVIPNSVDIERFAHAPPASLKDWGIADGSRVLISIGRLEEQKGFDLLLDAIAALQPIPIDVHFLIVGDGPDAARLRDQALRLQIIDHVHFLGRRADIPELLAAADGLILASRWEGMPNVVLEAMAAGKAVISTKVEGIPELVTDGVNGLLVDTEDSAALSRAIGTLLSDPNFADAAGKRSQQIAQEKFTARHTADSYSAVYRRLLATS